MTLTDEDRMIRFPRHKTAFWESRSTWKPDRVKSLLSMRNAGQSIQACAEHFGVTYERIRQILRTIERQNKSL